MLRKIKDRLAPYYRNIGGWRTNRRLVVIESDDWGSIRMPSRETYYRCLSAGFPVDKSPFDRYDSLLSEKDLELLFDTLLSFKDQSGRHPVITANVVMSNPDFDAIEKCGFSHYQYEPIQATFARYPKHGRCLSLWSEARDQGLFFPQFHGREHVNVALFMDMLRADNKLQKLSFHNRMPGCVIKTGGSYRNPFVETTRFRSVEEKKEVLAAQLEGLNMFASYFGYKSRTMIATNHIWSSAFDKHVSELGVEAFQGGFSLMEQNVDGSCRLRRKRLGQANEAGQIYFVRNARFEPSQTYTARMKSAEDCLSEVDIAFRLKKPAVISCHRINFCGFIDESNRDQNLHALNYLLESILKRWPDVEFITSTDLLDIVKQQA